jgi:putative aminopeptidase
MKLVDVMKDLMLTEAVSGYEQKMVKKMSAYFTEYADSVRMDRAGNTIAEIKGTDDSALKIMVFAHMDQLGFIVRKIEENGLIQIDRLGGIPEKVLPGLEVSVSTIDGEYIPGLIGNKAHHATSADEKYKVDLVTSLLIDIGASTKSQVLSSGIHIGCPICYKPSFTQLLGSRISGTATDNRGGCAALVQLANTLKENRPTSTVYLVGTVWEEFSIRGAIFAARDIQPDLAICIDVALPGDTPDLSGRYDVGLSKGPTVTLYNFHGRGTLNGTIAHNGLYKHALHCSKDLGINLQEFASLGMLTDSAYVQLEGNYIGCLDMGFPARYTHSPVETCDPNDIEQLTMIIAHMTRTMDGKFNINRF